MRTILGPLLAITAGCYGGEGVELYLTDVPSRCALFECPLALGATATVEVGLGIGDTVTQDDRFVVILEPADVLEVRRTASTLALTGLAEGTATLRIVHAYHELTAEVQVHVAAVARSAIVPAVARFGIAVGDRLTALHDSTIALETEHFDARDAYLMGHGIDAWTLRGASGAGLQGFPGARTQQLLTGDLEGFTVDTGTAELAVAVLGPDQVQRLELVNVDGRAPVAAPGEVVRVRERYNATFHVAAYDASGSYIAGGGRPGDFDAAGPGVRSVNRATRQVSLEIVDTALEVRLGQVAASFAIRYP